MEERWKEINNEGKRKETRKGTKKESKQGRKMGRKEKCWRWEWKKKGREGRGEMFITKRIENWVFVEMWSLFTPALMFAMWTINDKGFTLQDCDTRPWPHKAVFRGRSLFRHCRQKEKTKTRSKSGGSRKLGLICVLLTISKTRVPPQSCYCGGSVHYTSFPRKRTRQRRVRRIASLSGIRS